MDLIYCDESGDEKAVIFSALAVPDAHWHAAFQKVRQFRHDLLRTDGISIHAEFHAWKFVTGRGKLGDVVVTKQRRNIIFRQTLEMVASVPGLRVFTAVFPATRAEEAFEALLEGITRVYRRTNNYGLLILDQL